MKYFILMLIFMPFWSGCVRSTMLDANAKKLDLTKRSIALMRVKVSNEYKPEYQPFLRTAMLMTKGGYADFKIKSSALLVKEEKKYNEYLVTVDVPPGKYLMESMVGEVMTLVPPIDATSVMIPCVPFELKPNEIVYLGKIEGRIHKRLNDKELRAGIVIPLVDQMVAGFSTGTYDISVFDNYSADIPLFIQKYPILKNYTIKKAVPHTYKQPKTVADIKNFKKLYFK
ncbi:MAG: hypothetical protein LLF92_08060 [Planctomycetaceae bacterium]|nr:hypothetical protein [Planctomycetaceae bacterium]